MFQKFFLLILTSGLVAEVVWSQPSAIQEENLIPYPYPPPLPNYPSEPFYQDPVYPPYQPGPPVPPLPPPTAVIPVRPGRPSLWNVILDKLMDAPVAIVELVLRIVGTMVRVYNWIFGNGKQNRKSLLVDPIALSNIDQSRYDDFIKYTRKNL